MSKFRLIKTNLKQYAKDQSLGKITGIYQNINIFNFH